MDLLVDLGNSRLKWAFHAPQVWRTGAVGHEDALESRLEVLWAAERPTRVIVASVAGEDLTRRLCQWIQRRWSVIPVQVHAGPSCLGVRNGYRDPAQLGADRWAALVAAKALFQGRLCVVDCGTAITVDALSGQGEFIGGAILPGLGSMRRCLTHTTAALRDLAGNDDDCLARSTADAIAAGTRFAVAGAIDRLLDEYERGLGTPMPVVLTGGEAAVIQPDLNAQTTLIPDLVLRGLALIGTMA